MKVFAVSLLIVCLILTPPTSLSASPVDVYGYLVNFVGLTIRGDGPGLNGADVGYVLYLRLKGDWKPHESLSFHLEGSYTGSLGNQNPWALFDSYGILPFALSDDPTTDYVQSLAMDHAWAGWSGAAADLTFGKQPLAWGTGYGFNPTSRASFSGFLDTVHEETPGTFSWLSSISPTWWLTFEGYLAFQDKTASTQVLLLENSWQYLPFGVRAKILAGPVDITAGLVRETADFEGTGIPEERTFVTGDAVAAVGPVGLYGEAAYLLPLGDGESDWDAWGALDVVLGIEWLLPGVPVTCRAEYYRQGKGASEKASYDFTDLLTGRRSVLGMNYLFGNIEWTFLDYGRLNLSELVNLNDGSLILVPNIAWDFLADFTAEAGAMVFIGEDDDEFGGIADLGSGPVDLMEPSLYVKLKISF